jgi:hypothetical protein
MATNFNKKKAAFPNSLSERQKKKIINKNNAALTGIWATRTFYWRNDNYHKAPRCYQMFAAKLISAASVVYSTWVAV